MLYPPGFYYVKKPKRFVILSSDKSSERNLSCFFDIIKPRRIENLQLINKLSSQIRSLTEFLREKNRFVNGKSIVTCLRKLGFINNAKLKVSFVKSILDHC